MRFEKWKCKKCMIFFFAYIKLNNKNWLTVRRCHRRSKAFAVPCWRWWISRRRLRWTMWCRKRTRASVASSKRWDRPLRRSMAHVMLWRRSMLAHAAMMVMMVRRRWWRGRQMRMSWSTSRGLHVRKSRKWGIGLVTSGRSTICRFCRRWCLK